MMNATPIRVLLVDDHAVVREGYRALLNNAGNIDVVAEAASGEEACKLYLEHSPDIVIMDLSLPGISGLEAIRRIISRDSAARILVFSMHENTVFVEQALQAGASGYVTKSSAPNAMINAVRHIAKGAVYIEQDVARRLAVQKTKGADNPCSALSAREFEIFRMLAEGASINDIAKRLSLSYKTVANYGTRIKSKLDVNNSADLARIAIRCGVVDV